MGEKGKFFLSLPTNKYRRNDGDKNVIINRLSVPMPACKELRSHHSTLTTGKNLNKLKNQLLFLDMSEK